MNIIAGLKWFKKFRWFGGHRLQAVVTEPGLVIDYNLSGKWVRFLWYQDQDLIHPLDLPELSGKGFNIAFCIEDEGEFLRLQHKSLIFRGKKTGVKKVLPSPAFLWGEKIKIISKPELNASIDHFFWHFKDEKFYYHIIANNKILRKRYDKTDLVAILE